MNKNFDVQKSITLISEEIDLKDYVKCEVFLINTDTKVIIAGEKNFDKVEEILDEIKYIGGGYDSLILSWNNCYIHKSMLHNKNVYLNYIDFLNDFPEIKELYLEETEYQVL